MHEDYADFQIGHLLFFLKQLGTANVNTVSIDGEEVRSLGGLKIKPDDQLNHININDYDLLLIPGGDSINCVADNIKLHQLIKNAYEKNIFIASMCGSAAFLGKAGILQDKSFTCNINTYEYFKDDLASGHYTGKDVETSHSGFLTAKGVAVAEFTVAVLERLNLFHNVAQKNKVLAFCKSDL